ncbi:hypothetical protein Mapa_011900 [Marchantia paleacea]|nr:hypothetical protein Mapa_011900 [Marchantia paleacea]
MEAGAEALDEVLRMTTRASPTFTFWARALPDRPKACPAKVDEETAVAAMFTESVTTRRQGMNCLRVRGMVEEPKSWRIFICSTKRSAGRGRRWTWRG